MTAKIVGATPFPFRLQMRACRAFPPGNTPFDILPPASARHRSTIRSSVEVTESSADQKVYAFTVSRRIMNDPSPSKIPASHAASVSVMARSYRGHGSASVQLNPEYAAMARRRIAGPLFAEAGA